MWLKVRHFIASKIGTVSAQTCIDNGCSEFHGTSPSQAMLFVVRKDPFTLLVDNIVDELKRRELAKGRFGQ